ncbi:MAG: hypothetical protein H6819_01330 [Phycisphaerales bacterium]|nr:hypothetical protein [Phycisphaerales bacterium]MCB9857150.1 hypothetical protein [Phycisphaerales bacterium]
MMAAEPIDNPVSRLRAEAAAFAESDYILRHWNFAASSHGFVWVSPAGESVSVESLAGFISLFIRCCDADFPTGVLFDFSKSRLIGEDWTSAFSLVQDFAGRIGARYRVIRAGDRRAKAALVYRESRRAELREARRRAKQSGESCVEDQ